MRVVLSVEGRADFNRLPAVIKARVEKIMERLKDYPNVSGVKALTGPLAGYSRIRTGDWRVMFFVATPDLIIVRIQHRREVYE